MTEAGPFAARHFDGRTPQPRPATVRVDAGGVIVTSDGDSRRWPIESVVVVRRGGGGEAAQIELIGEPIEALSVADASFVAALETAAGRRVRHVGGGSMALRTVLVLAAVAGLALFAAWRWGIPALAAVAADHVPPAWERQFGAAVVRDLAPESERVHDPTVTGVVDEAFERLTRATPAPRDSFTAIVARSKVVNAFAAPGGYIVVTTGLLRTLGGPDELAGVIAHEMTHVARRHTTRGLFARQGLHVLVGLVAGDHSAFGTVLGAAGTLGELSYSRADEAEADAGAVELLARAGLPPDAMVRALDRMEKGRGTAHGPELEFLSSHPGTSNRRARAIEQAARVAATPGAPLDSLAWRAMRSSLAARPDSSTRWRPGSNFMAQAPGAEPAAPPDSALSRWFRFESSMWVNLHHLLMQQTGSATGPRARAPRLATVDTSGWKPAERAGWNRALDYYRGRMASRDLLFDDGMIAIRDELARLGPNKKVSASETIGDSLAAALNDASLGYRKRLWPAHDAGNRAFEHRLEQACQPYLARLPDSLCRWLGTPWPVEPIRVDIAVDAGWTGAYTTLGPPHIVISSIDPRHEGPLVVEVLFHEASHVLIEPLQQGIAEECRRAGKEVTRDLWHATLFYTAGYAVQSMTGPDYAPYAERFGLFARGRWVHYHTILREAWLPYLQGEGTSEAAITKLVARLD